MALAYLMYGHQATFIAVGVYPHSRDLNRNIPAAICPQFEALPLSKEDRTNLAIPGCEKELKAAVR